MGTTSNMSIPYPESSDYVADGATAMENIATQVDSKTGLVFISQNSIGASTVPSYTVSNCFSSSFDFYYVTIRNLQNSGNQPSLRLQLGSATTNHRTAGFYIQHGTSSLTATNLGPGASFVIADCATSNTRASYDVTIKDPYTSQRTFINAQNSSATWVSSYMGVHDSFASHTGFTIFANVGLISEGIITVYGASNG